MLALLLAALGGSVVLQDSAAARADSLMAVGRAQFARPVIGRYAALAAFRAAGRLAPTNPEPLYWQMKVGFYLGSDEGDVLAREAILGILALDPDYEDAWERFGTLYRNPQIWRRADRALARYPDQVVAMERRAEVAIALEAPLRADSLLAEVLRRRGPYLPAYLARAEASFDAGRDSAGYAWYDSALAYADVDSTGAMWDAVWMIATPEEVGAHDATPPGERRRFFERFWTTRDPNLLTAGNERIAEHFRRFAYARRFFRLLHPMNLYHRSPRYRALIAAGQRDFLEARAQQEADPYPGAESDRRLAAGRQLPDVRPTHCSVATSIP
jgi:GWxTD domain-containing protein